MNRAFHIGIMLAVAVHMVFGCCSHHAHGSHPADSAYVAKPCECAHHGHEGAGEPADHRPGDRGCDDNHCVFTVPESSDASQAAIGADGVSFICVVPIMPGLNGIDSVDTIPHHCNPPVPLHLLNQVLLI